MSVSQSRNLSLLLHYGQSPLVRDIIYGLSLGWFASSSFPLSSGLASLARQFSCLDFKTPLCRARTWNFEDLRLLDAAAPLLERKQTRARKVDPTQVLAGTDLDSGALEDARARAKLLYLF